jgi:hypothetical protein
VAAEKVAVKAHNKAEVLRRRDEAAEAVAAEKVALNLHVY